MSKRYTVFALDMWGHVSADCKDHGCPCVKGDEHDDDACSCHEDMNDRSKVGTIEVEGDTDEAILDALLSDSFLSISGHQTCKVEDTGDGMSLDIVDREGRRIFYLETDEDWSDARTAHDEQTEDRERGAS